ncbi:hypothetical protein V8G54_018927 [Vigna mungo]|uniref:Uncharacterized protein n=1 Tax=Vigna mungo TaxID=3915 RepID=A0AAQ3RV79_VIGMU
MNEKEAPEPATTAKSKTCEPATTVAAGEPQSIRRVVFPPPSHPVPPQYRLIAGVKKGNPKRRRSAVVFSSPTHRAVAISTNLILWEKLPRNAMGKEFSRELPDGRVLSDLNIGVHEGTSRWPSSLGLKHRSPRGNFPMEFTRELPDGRVCSDLNIGVHEGTSRWPSSLKLKHRSSRGNFLMAELART